jgi:hypothetical protein
MGLVILSTIGIAALSYPDNSVLFNGQSASHLINSGIEYSWIRIRC